jgi:hypothetical protein
MKKGDVRPIETPRGIILFFLADAKGRKTKRVRIPERIRKQQRERLEELMQKRKEFQEKKRAAALENAAVSDQEKASGKGEAAKIKDLGILTPEETKEYRKVRKKVFFILKTKKTQERMKDWIEALKKNSIIDIRL